MIPAELACFEERCRARFPITDIVYNCPRCGGLLETVYRPRAFFLGVESAVARAAHIERAARSERRLALPRVHRVPRRLPHVVTLREGNTPLLTAAPRAAAYGGLDHLAFKHQGFNPTGSFKDNGMTCGVAQAVRLGVKRVACVSTGNTSASMAAYASAAGLQPMIFIPHGNIVSASWRRRWNMARAPSRWRPISTRSWPWYGSSPNAWGSTC